MGDALPFVSEIDGVICKLMTHICIRYVPYLVRINIQLEVRSRHLCLDASVNKGIIHTRLFLLPDVFHLFREEGQMLASIEYESHSLRKRGGNS
jgi:hypothetical protein